jgi:tRNA pseudouridine55 synthase
MPNIICIYKPIGLTPLQALDRLRLVREEYQTATLSYAGRLDPLAEGLLLVLVNEENQHREAHLAHNKTYEVEILLGVSTDTGDVLGLVEQITDKAELPDEPEIKNNLKRLEGTRTQQAPAFSSPGIDGKDFSREVTVTSAKFLGAAVIDRHYLGNLITGRVNAVSGDFRQGKVVQVWRDALTSCAPQTTFPVIKCELECSSGTYMRLLASELGQSFNLPALALSIKRTKVGPHTLDEAILLE